MEEMWFSQTEHETDIFWDSVDLIKIVRTWLEVVQRDCQVRGLSRDDIMVHGRWRKLIRMAAR